MEIINCSFFIVAVEFWINLSGGLQSGG